MRTPLLLGICLTTLAAQGLDQGWSSVLLPVDVRVKFGSVLDLGMLETVFALSALAGAVLYGAMGYLRGVLGGAKDGDPSCPAMPHRARPGSVRRRLVGRPLAAPRGRGR
jgi:hypothetical protein